jgi:hypothetical protein
MIFSENRQSLFRIMLSGSKGTRTMALASKFVCSGCRWWYFQPTEGADPESEQAVGYCRRFPPTRRDNGVGAWPITFGNDWCGEYAEKNDVSRQLPRSASVAH